MYIIVLLSQMKHTYGTRSLKSWFFNAARAAGGVGNRYIPPTLDLRVWMCVFVGLLKPI